MPLTPSSIHAVRHAVEIAGDSARLANELRARSTVAADAINAVASSASPRPEEVADAVVVARWYKAAGDPWAAAALSLAEEKLAGTIVDIFYSLLGPTAPAADPETYVEPAVGETYVEPAVGETYGDYKNRAQGAPVLGPDGQEISAGLTYDGQHWI